MWIALGLAWAGAGSVAIAADAPPAAPRPPSVATEVDALLRALLSDDYAAREAARARLTELAPAARAQLVARRDDPDPEVRRTVAHLLAAIGEAEPTPSPTGTLGELGQVTFRAEGRLREVLDRWAEEVGGRVTVPGVAASREVAVAVAGVPYFEALDAMLAPAGLDVPYGFDDAGGLVAGPRGEGAVAAAFQGPFRLDVTSVLAERTLRPASRRDLSMRLRLAWAPTVQVTAVNAPRVVRAVDASGASLVGLPMQTVYGVGGARWTQIELRFAPWDGPLADRLTLVDLTTEVRVRSEGQSVVFEDLAASALPTSRSVAKPAGPGAGGSGETRVTLVAFGPDPERSGWDIAELVVSAARGVPAESVAVVLEAAGASPRVLTDQASRIVAADGTARLRVRTPSPTTDVARQGLRVLWYAKEETVAVPFTLKEVPLR